MNPSSVRASPPVGVTALAAFHGIGVIVALAVLIFAYARSHGSLDFLSRLDTLGAITVVTMPMLLMIVAASAVGLMLGHRWGWRLAAFAYVYSIIDHGIMLLVIASEASEDSARSTVPLVRNATLIVFHSLMLAYLLKSNVLRYFRLEHLGRIRLLAPMVGICVTLAIVIVFLLITFD